MKINKEFETRFAKHEEELRWLYMELYNNGSMYAELCDQMPGILPEAADGSEGKRPGEKQRIPSGTGITGCWG